MNPDTLVPALGAAGLPIEGSVVYTEETDPNSNLGRPGQYTGKVSWVDARLRDDCLDESEPGFDCGGTAEFFADDEDRDERYDYLGSFADQPLVGGYYMWRMPKIVVRVGYGLTPDQAGEYAVVLEGLFPGEVEQFEP